MHKNRSGTSCSSPATYSSPLLGAKVEQTADRKPNFAQNIQYAGFPTDLFNSRKGAALFVFWDCPGFLKWENKPKQTKTNQQKTPQN